MSWNEPGNRDDANSKKRNPWGRQEEPGPPNLDEVFKQLHQKWRALFTRGEVRGGGGGAPVGVKPSWYGVYLLLGVFLAAYLLSGIYVVEPAEEAVVLRFGRYLRTEGSGPHWILPLIETKKVLNVQEVRTAKYGGQMLTKDENIVTAEIAVQYRIGDARNYLFNLVNPVHTLKQVSESALRAVVGQSTLNEVLTSGRSEIGAEIRKQIQQNLDNYESGIRISDMAMQQTKAPEAVKGAFDDAIKAQQDEESFVNEAQAYARKKIPIAEGLAKRTLEEARAYGEEVIMKAQGETAKFLKLLPEYQMAPEVTRRRLYLDAMEAVYGKASKILVDPSAGNPVIYLPVDRLLQGQSSRTSGDSDAASTPRRAQQTESLSGQTLGSASEELAERVNQEEG